MLKFISSGLFVTLLAACGGSDSHSAGPDVPPAQLCISNCDQPVQPTQPGQPGQPSATTDTISPRILAFHQEGLERLVVEFSEPIKQIYGLSYSEGFSTPSWSEDRKTLTAAFDPKKFQNFGLQTLNIGNFTDDVGNRSSQSLSIPVDNLAPVIDAVKVIDSTTLELVWNEEVKLQSSSKILVNQQFVGTPESLESTGKKTRVQVPKADLLADQSHIVAVTTVADVYGNSASQRSKGFASIVDHEAPRILSIRQLPTLKKGNVAMIGFEMEYSEYTVDGRDADSTGILGDLTQILESLRDVTINDDKLFLFEGIWEPRADHRGGALYFPWYAFKHAEKNTIGLSLTDIAGNTVLAEASLTFDARGPWIEGSYSKQDQCLMTSKVAFRCHLSDTDVVTAVLKPETDFPATDYEWKTETETVDGTVRNWIVFAFKNKIPERLISDITMTDSLKNDNTFSGNLVAFLPRSEMPEFTGVKAFNNQLLELGFTRSVDRIEKLLVDGKPYEFTMTYVDEFRSLDAKHVLIRFKDEIPDGKHRIEIQGAARLLNHSLVMDNIVLDNVDNTGTDIIHMSIGQDKGVWRNMDVRFELTRPLAGQTISAEAFTTLAAGETKTQALTDISWVEEGATNHGTWSILLHKKSAAGLIPNYGRQAILLKVGDHSAERFEISWTTQEPKFYTFNMKPTAEGFFMITTVDLDLDGLQAEIIGNAGTIQLERAWLKKADEDSYHGFRVTLPEGKKLATGQYRLRVTAARTQIFGIELSSPFETLFEVN